MPTQWLNTMVPFLRAWDVLKEPDSETAPSETVIGEMDLELKQLYSVWQATVEAMLEMLQELDQTAKPARGTLDLLEQYNAKATALECLFWISVNDAFGNWDDSIGVRRGWKVVRCPDAPEKQPTIEVERRMYDQRN